MKFKNIKIQKKEI